MRMHSPSSSFFSKIFWYILMYYITSFRMNQCVFSHFYSYTLSYKSYLRMRNSLKHKFIVPDCFKRLSRLPAQIQQPVIQTSLPLFFIGNLLETGILSLDITVHDEKHSAAFCRNFRIMRYHNDCGPLVV